MGMYPRNYMETILKLTEAKVGSTFAEYGLWESNLSDVMTKAMLEAVEKMTSVTQGLVGFGTLPRTVYLE